MTTEKLPTASPCKHCGSTDIFVEREDLQAYQTRCNDCGARGPIVEDGKYYADEEAGQRDAIIAWNRRATPAAPTPTAALTPEELAAQTAASLFDGTIITESRLREAIAAAIRQHSEAQRAEIERLTALVDKMADMSYHPEACPITGRPFFMTIDGKATYGGPFDSYTIPRRDDDGQLVCEQFDHDEGGWVGGLGLSLHVVSEETLGELEEKAAAAEAALAASQERERVMWEAAQPVADAFRAMGADWTGDVPDDQRLIAPDITVGQMRSFCAALQPQETADVR